MFPLQFPFLDNNTHENLNRSFKDFKINVDLFFFFIIKKAFQQQFNRKIPDHTLSINLSYPVISYTIIDVLN